MTRIPYVRHTITDRDIAAVVDVLKSPRLTQGPMVPAFELGIAKVLDVDPGRVVACSSGTAALHLAYRALAWGHRSRVLVPAITFTATAAAAVHCGAEVVLVDVDPVTGLAGAGHFEEADATHGTYPLWVPVHLRGDVCDMATIRNRAVNNGADVVEDAAHAFGAEGVGDSDATAFSFHPAKHVACGEGGAVVLRSPNDARLTRQDRAHGFCDDGDLFVPGFNYRLSDIHAALGLSQLQRLEYNIKLRRSQAKRYRQLLDRRVVRHIPEQSGSAQHLFVVHVEDIEGMRAHLLSKGIETQRHYRPLNHYPAYGGPHLPGAEEYYRTALSLPLYPGLTVAEQDRVIDAVNGRE